MTSDTTRLMDLEIRLTHQEAAIEEINEVLLRQQRILESLRADLKNLQQQMRAMAPSNIASSTEETPPPHY